MPFVYVLCSRTTGRYCTGSTQDLGQRLRQHNSDLSISTKHRGLRDLVHREEYASLAAAVPRERFLKTGKGRDELKRICQSSRRKSRSAGVGTQIRGKRFASINSRMSRASRSSVFCLRTSLARIFAEFPIQSSCPNSASSRSNQCSGPVASTPTRTGLDRSR